jgi:PAS domain S-box-containing protein
LFRNALHCRSCGHPIFDIAPTASHSLEYRIGGAMTMASSSTFSSAPLLATVGSQVAAATDLVLAASTAVTALVPAFADIATIHLPQADGILGFVAGRHRNPGCATFLAMSDLPTIASGMCEGRAIIIPRSAFDQHWTQGLESDPMLSSVTACLVAPFQGEDGPAGTLFAAVLDDREFDDRDLETATVVAALLSGAFSRIRAERQAGPDFASRSNFDQSRSTESSFARVFDLSPLILSVSDLETGRFLEINEAFVQATGFSREEIIGRTPIELGLWVAPEQRTKGLNEIRSGHVIRSQEMRFRIKDGSIRDVLLSGAMVEFQGRAAALSALTDVTDRKRAENLLLRYQLLAQNSRDILIFFRLDGTIVEANAAAAETYGYTPEEFLKLHVSDLRAPDLISELPAQFSQALERGIRFETRHRRRDGTTFPVDVVSQSADLGGERLVLSIIRDVTERAEVEAALRASEERFRLALDAAGMSTWEIDFETGKRTAGGFHEQLLGAAPDSIEGILAMVHPDDRDRVRHAVEHAIQHQTDYAEEFRILHPNGNMRWIAAHGRAIGAAQGRPQRLAGVSYDITDRKQAESLLLASEERFRALAETMPLLVWTCEPDGGCDYLSRQWLNYTGSSEAEQLGFGWMEVVHPDDRDHVAATWQAAVAGIALFDVELRIRRYDGVYRWFKTRAAPVRDDDGNIIKWYGSNTDIDDLKQAEERRRELIDTLAHDLKNPLAAMKAQAQILRRRLARGQEVSRESLDMLAETATKMAELIDEMSDASKLAAGQDLELEIQPLDLVALVRSAAAAYAGSSSLHSVRIEEGVQNLVGEWDRARLERVFGNLLANAIKYSPNGGEIVVRIDREVDDSLEKAVVAITDHGIGIPEVDLQHIFERHRRGRNVGRIRGNGLGLAGAADVVRLHGGTITVASQEGAGSTFTVKFPLAPVGNGA